jgi:hypothetical protein
MDFARPQCGDAVVLQQWREIQLRSSVRRRRQLGSGECRIRAGDGGIIVSTHAGSGCGQVHLECGSRDGAGNRAARAMS